MKDEIISLINDILSWNEELLTKEKKLIEEVEFWKTLWIDSQSIPDRFSEDRKKRIRDIFVQKYRHEGMSPEELLQSVFKMFEAYPQ